MKNRSSFSRWGEFLGFAAVFIACSSVRGYSAGRVPVQSFTFSVPHLLQCIYKNNLSQQSLQVIEAQAARRQALGQLLFPTVTAAVGGSVNHDSSLAVSSKGGSESIILNQQLLNFSQWSTISALKLKTDAAGFERETKLFDLLQSGISSYYASLTVSSQIEFEEKRLKRLEQMVRLTEELDHLNVADKSDLYSLRAQRANSEYQLKSLELAKVESSQSLSDLLHVDMISTSFSFSDREPKNSPGTLPEESIDQLVAQQPAVHALESYAKSSHEELRSAMLTWLPTVSVDANYINGQITTVGQPFSGSTQQWAAQAVLSWSVFDQGRSSAEKGRARGAESVYEDQVLQQKRNLKNFLVLLTEQVRSEQKLMELTSEQEKLSQKAFELAWTLFSLGKKSFIALKIVEEDLAKTELNFVQIRSRWLGSLWLLWLYQSYAEGRPHFNEDQNTCPGGDQAHSLEFY